MLSLNPDLLNKLINSVIITGIGLLVFYLVFYFIKLKAKSKKSYIPALLEKYVHFPGMLFFLIITLNIDLGNFKDYLNERVFNNLKHTLLILVIASLCYLLINIVKLVKEIVITHFERQKRTDFKLRAVKTQFLLIQRVINIIIITGAVSGILMTFSQIRQLGGALLASAGVAGLIIGLAAQKSLGSILAGIQIALTQPVKIEDTVVVEGKFGTVGEITLTYVVINTWDGKRLIIPISYFLEKPFENWTRVSAEVIGKVKINASYELPLDHLRVEFEHWVKETPLWDERKAALLLTGVNEKTIEIQATMSAKNSDDAFDLECYIREKLVAYIKDFDKNGLPAKTPVRKPSRATKSIK